MSRCDSFCNHFVSLLLIPGDLNIYSYRFHGAILSSAESISPNSQIGCRSAEKNKGKMMIKEKSFNSSPDNYRCN